MNMRMMTVIAIGIVVGVLLLGVFICSTQDAVREYDATLTAEAR